MLQVLICTSEFLLTCVFTVKSFVEIVKFIFKIPGVKFFLSERISQDPLENFFGCQRQRARTAENPNAFQFCKNSQAIRVINSVCGNVPKGNCRGRAQSIDIQDDKPLSKRRRVRKKKLKLTMNEDSLAEPLPQTVPPSSGAISLSESGPSFSIDKPLPQAVPPSKPLPQVVPMSKPLPEAVLPSSTTKSLPKAVPPFKPLPKVAVPPSKPLPEAVPLSSAAKSLPEAVPPSKAVPPSSVTKLIPEAVQQSLRSGSQGEVLVNAVALTRQDLLTISNSGWLNDKVCYSFQCKFITFILQYRPSTYI